MILSILIQNDMSMGKSKQNIIIILTAVIVVAAACTLTISYLPYFSQSKIAPELEKTGESIININNNSQQQPLTMADLKGKVVLVNFWTYSCINVLRTLPHLIDWNAKYGGDKGLVIVGVHTPEFGFEKNTDFVKTSLQKYGIKYPVIQDNDYKIWNAYGNNYWPRMYLVDDKGVIRYDKVGEGEYNQTEKVIRSLLSERNSKGKCKNNHNNLELQSDTGRIVLIYSAQYVNLVAGGTGQGIVYEDNSLLSNHSKGVDTANKDSKFVIDYPRLYNIVNHQSHGDEDFHSLIIDVKGKGFQAYV